MKALRAQQAKALLRLSRTRAADAPGSCKLKNAVRN